MSKLVSRQLFRLYVAGFILVWHFWFFWGGITDAPSKNALWQIVHCQFCSGDYSGSRQCAIATKVGQ